MDASIAPGELVWQRCPASSTTTRFWPTRFSTSTSLRSSHGISNAPCSSSTSSSRSFGMTGSTSHPRTANDLCTGAAPKNPFGFAPLLAALDFMQRGPLEIVFAGDRAQPALQPLVETVHRTYQPSRILAFADDVPIGQGRGPIDGKPAAYVCRNRTCEAPLTSAEALRERFST